MQERIVYHSSKFPGLTIRIEKARGPKCPRCWNHDINIGKPGHHPELCDRCAQVLKDEAIILNNPILTLQELKDMYNAEDGPIWVHYGVAIIPAILDYYDGKLIAIWDAEGKDEGLWEDTYGVTWIAYRHRPIEEEDRYYPYLKDMEV